jgi:hypothetical protein
MTFARFLFYAVKNMDVSMFYLQNIFDVLQEYMSCSDWNSRWQQ